MVKPAGQPVGGLPVPGDPTYDPGFNVGTTGADSAVLSNSATFVVGSPESVRRELVEQAAGRYCLFKLSRQASRGSHSVSSF